MIKVKKKQKISRRTNKRTQQREEQRGERGDKARQAGGEHKHKPK